MLAIDSNLRKYVDSIKKTHYKDVLRYDNRKKVKYWDYPAAASICYSPEGIPARGCSQRPLGISWDSVLQSVMRRIGKIGEQTGLCYNILGNCAEQHSANNLAKKTPISYIGISNLRFSTTIRPRTMQVLKPCHNCKAIFPSLNV